MAPKLLSLLVTLFVFSTSFSCIRSRPLPPSEQETINVVADELPIGVIRGLVLDGMKNSGPSQGGGGHKFVDIGTLGGIKNSGPSSGGGGHAYVNADTLGGVKNSGPSPGGGGHKL